MGGEKPRRGSGLNLRLGSPPHGRGKVFAYHLRHTGAGITPAWAGKSIWPIPHKSFNQDHPRMGGEKLLLLSPM